MDAILEGRAEYAATLADLGFVPGDFVQHTRRGAPTAGAGVPRVNASTLQHKLRHPKLNTHHAVCVI